MKLIICPDPSESIDLAKIPKSEYRYIIAHDHSDDFLGGIQIGDNGLYFLSYRDQEGDFESKDWKEVVKYYMKTGTSFHYNG